MNDLIERYLACWNETEPAARRKLIDDLWAEEASYAGRHPPPPGAVHLGARP
jgi:hypothetical protein